MSKALNGAGALAGIFSLAAAAIAAAAPGSAPSQQAAHAKGGTLFKQRCAMCHTIAGSGGKLGPDLTGVVGRKAGSTAYGYSAALRSSKIVWDVAALDTFLAAPSKAIPGTRMAIAISDPQDRQAIVSYLEAAGN